MADKCTCNPGAYRVTERYRKPGPIDATNIPTKPGFYWVHEWEFQHCMKHGWYGYLPDKRWSLIHFNAGTDHGQSTTYTLEFFGSDEIGRTEEVAVFGPRIEEPAV